MAMKKKPGRSKVEVGIPSTEAVFSAGNNNASGSLIANLATQNRAELAYELREIALQDIELNPDNAIFRQLDTDEDVETLANDIDRNGLMHNLVVYPRTDGKQTKYVLLSGERRKAVAELVSCLQAEPYNLTAAEAKKAIKEATPINGRQIDKDLSIEKNLNEGLKALLDRGFVLRSEAESFLRMTPEEQRIAAQMLQQLYAIAYNGPGSAAIQDEKKAIRGRFVDALRTVADTSSMQDAHEALVAAVFTVQKEMACLKETIRKVKTIPPEQPAAQVEQTEVIREVREKTAGAKAQSKITGKLSSQTSRLETMLRRKNPEKRLAEKYTHEERRQAMKELDEMIATATRLREIIAKVERSADEAQEV